MRKIILISTVLCSCSHSNNEMDAIANEVIRKKEGIEIDFKPLQEEKGVPLVEKKF